MFRAVNQVSKRFNTVAAGWHSGCAAWSLLSLPPSGLSLVCPVLLGWAGLGVSHGFCPFFVPLHTGLGLSDVWAEETFP